MKLIDKAAVVAEIEKLIDSHKPLKTLDPTYCEGLNDSLDDVLSILNTLEVKEESVSKDLTEALRMEYEKGRADVLRCIDPDEMVADFCSQPLSKTRSIASIYRQGIMDILKRINNNEETSITGTHSIDDCGL